MKKKFIFTIVLLFVLLAGKTQWSTDPQVNSVVCNLSGEQAVPHIAYDDVGNFYVGFYSNDNGNYDIRLQYYNFSGVAQWADNGILISNHTQNSWITDWDLTTDNTGNCILAFNDVRDGNANVYAYSIDPSGTFNWGADGIQLTSDSQDEFVPSVSVTSSNNVIVAWSRPTATQSKIIMQKITPSGNLSWGSGGIAYQSGSQSYTGARVLGVDGDNYLLGFYKETGNFPALTRHIYAQKFDGSGVPVWSGDVLVSNSNGISSFNNFTIASDDANGIIFAWTDDRNSDMNIDAAVQRVLNDGTITWPSNGSLCMTSTSNSNQNPQILGVTSDDEVVVTWSKKSSNQSETAIAGQKFSVAGSHLWGNDGIEFIAMSPDISGVIGGAAFDGNNSMIIYEEYVSGSTVYTNIKGLAVDNSGTLIWNPASTLVAGRSTEKVHPVTTPVFNDMLIAVWEDGSPSDIYMQNIYTDGTIGDPPLSDDATLSDLTVNGITVEGFDPGVFYYEVGIPTGDPTPITGATPNDPAATMVITQASTVPSSSDVVVTAEDGVTQLTYTIDFHVAGTDATLSDLIVNGVSVPGFAPDVFTYDYSVATGMPIPVVGATSTDPYATTIITQATTLPGTATVDVTSEDGQYTNTYTINFLYTPGTDATLSDLLVAGITIEGFDPNIFDYTYATVYPTSTPYVMGIPNDTLASAEDNQCLQIPCDATVVVTAEDGVTQLTYTVSFYYLGYDATLADLTVDGETIPEFDPQTQNYQYAVTDTLTIPVVDGTPADTNATVEITQATQIPGEAVLLVTAEDGVTQLEYTIYFYPLASDATLIDLTVDDETIEGFDPAILSYEVNVPDGQPVPIIDGVPTDTTATMVITQSAEVPGQGTIVVTAQDGVTQNTYTVVFKLITSVFNDPEKNVIVYPNPASHFINIEGISMQGKYSIANFEGKITQKGDVGNQIYVGNLPKGIYTFVLYHNNRVITTKRIIINQ